MEVNTGRVPSEYEPETDMPRDAKHHWQTNMSRRREVEQTLSSGPERESTLLTPWFLPSGSKPMG